jgi:hypothetical protein
MAVGKYVRFYTYIHAHAHARAHTHTHIHTDLFVCRIYNMC